MEPSNSNQGKATFHIQVEGIPAISNSVAGLLSTAIVLSFPFEHSS